MTIIRMYIINICNKIIEYSFYLLFFLVPLVIASDTSELFEFNKMWLTFGLTLVIAANWFTKMILQRRIRIQKTPLDIPILLFLLSQFISTIFSWDTHISFWGYYSRFNGGFLSIISYIFLYYAFVSNLTNPVSIVKRLLLISVFSGLVVALWGLPSHFGYDPTCFLFRQTFDVSCWTADFQPKVRIFSTLGQPAWLAAYLAILLPISIVLFINKFKLPSPTTIKYQKSIPDSIGDKNQKYILNFKFIFTICYLIFTILFYLDLLYTQARSGIIAVGLSLGFFVVGYVLAVRRQLLKLAVLLIILLSITFFIGTPFSQIHKFTFDGIKEQVSKNKIENTKNTIQKQAQPNPSQHFGELGGTDSGKIRSIVWKGAINIWKQHPLFGTGVETFAYAYYRYKEASHNLTSEWNFLYNKAHNEFLNYLATTGLFGLGTYLLMIGWFLFLSVRQISKSEFLISKEIPNPKSQLGQLEIRSIRNLALALLASYLSILITNFFGFSVVITNIYLFMIPAFVFVLGGMIHKEKQFIFPKDELVRQPTDRNYESRVRVSIYQWPFIVVLLFTILYLLFTLVKFWLADKNYALGYNLDRAGEYQKAYPYLHKAVEQRNEPVFKDELAVNDALLAVSLFNLKDSVENKEDLKAQTNNLVQEAINTSDELTSSYQNNIVFWKTRTRIFYTLSRVDPRYLPFALEAIEKAASLSPNDASISYNLGVLYGQNDDVKNGINTLEHTIRLKPDYKDAYYALGLFYHEAAIDKKGEVQNQELEKKAIAQMQFILNNLSPNDTGAKEALKSWEKE